MPRGFLQYGGNILLMGCPGAGKSTVGAIVAEILGMPLVDFDADVLEKVWGVQVYEKVRHSTTKLLQLGSNGGIVQFVITFCYSCCCTFYYCS